MSGSKLSRAEFLRGDLARMERGHLMEAFGADGSIRDVIGVIGDGKEATVYACEAGPDTGVERAVAKVYRAQKFRAFASGAAYEAGRQIKDGRLRRALENRSRFGRSSRHQLWVDREWETLTRAFDAGADVPEPYARSSDAILMELVVDDDGGVAPLLRQVRLSGEVAESAYRSILQNVERLLACDRVHGDLSAYNILWTGSRVCLIDFPQAVDARRNPHAAELLVRDVRNVSRHFARCGVKTSADDRAHGLWSRYRRGEL